MTIFLEVAKKILVDKANAIIEASTTADQSTANTIASMFNRGRDMTVSRAKREVIRRLLAIIEPFEATENDTTTLAQLKKAVSEHLSEVEQLGLAKNQARGNTEIALEGFDALLQSIFEKLHQLDVLERIHDKDPLNCFRHAVALYCAKTIADRHAPSTWGQLVTNALSKIEFIKEQEDNVLQALTECILNLDTIDQTHAYAEKTRQTLVNLTIIALQQTNVAVGIKHTKLMLLNPDDGFLERCLQTAQTEILSPSTASISTSVPRRGARPLSMSLPGASRSTSHEPLSLTEAREEEDISMASKEHVDHLVPGDNGAEAEPEKLQRASSSVSDHEPPPTRRSSLAAEGLSFPPEGSHSQLHTRGSDDRDKRKSLSREDFAAAEDPSSKDREDAPSMSDHEHPPTHRLSIAADELPTPPAESTPQPHTQDSDERDKHKAFSHEFFAAEVDSLPKDREDAFAIAASETAETLVPSMSIQQPSASPLSLLPRDDKEEGGGGLRPSEPLGQKNSPSGLNAFFSKRGKQPQQPHQTRKVGGKQLF